jgi:hypothetical protein
VRPKVERRDTWARYLAAHRALAVSSDRLAALDDAGLAWTRQLLVDAADEAAAWLPDGDDPQQGHLEGERTTSAR